MSARILGGLRRLRDWLGRLPVVWLVAMGGIAVAVLVWAGIFMYRTYDYVQHDNEFCVSCHLMEDPFRRFGQSAHRGLGCKACHQPTMVVRTRMAMRQVLENPETLETHAEVPNERCAECHIKGDSEKWRQIASSAGHRVHLESKDPALRGLQCVQCHSSEIHEFTTKDKTCGQSGCHAGTSVRLGKMGSLTIHCAACHSFSRPVGASFTADSLAGALRPQREECLSCHAMRERLGDFPANEPHNGACGACHNPHEQRTAGQAVQTCATSGCHARPDTITPFHRGLDAGVMDECTRCHQPHGWKARGTDCVSCHSDILSPTGPRGARPAAVSRTPPSLLPHPAAASRGHPAAPAAPGGAGMLPALFQQVVLPTQEAAQDADRGPFSHVRHRAVECTRCHESRTSHGALRVRTGGDCQSCHHAPDKSASCIGCHPPSEITAQTTRRAEIEMTVWKAPRTRTLPFRHQWHAEVACSSCHNTPGSFAVGVACTSCHEQHHGNPRSLDCRSCHQASEVKSHTRASHSTCAGSGCHQGQTAQSLPAVRNVCLACHEKMERHYPGRECAACHRVAWLRRVALENR